MQGFASPLCALALFRLRPFIMGDKNKKSGAQAAKGGVISLQEHPLFIYEEDLIMNHVALTGKISQDIELHTTGNTTIHLAVQSDYYKAGEEPT